MTLFENSYTLNKNILKSNALLRGKKTYFSDNNRLPVNTEHYTITYQTNVCTTETNTTDELQFKLMSKQNYDKTPNIH